MSVVRETELAIRDASHEEPSTRIALLEALALDLAKRHERLAIDWFEVSAERDKLRHDA